MSVPEEHFVNNLLQKIPTLVPLTVTRPKVYIDTITTFIFDSYGVFEETFIHIYSLKR